MIGEKRRKSADACSEMADVRYEIDRLDRVLVRLLAERQSYIEAAARIKGDRTTVRDERRIEDVVAKVLASARREGLSPEIAEPVWRLLIDRCIAHEFRVFDTLQAGADPTAGSGSAELRKLLSERRRGNFISGAELTERIDAMMARKRRDRGH